MLDTEKDDCIWKRVDLKTCVCFSVAKAVIGVIKLRADKAF